MDILELEGMEFWARHGCLGREKAVEQLFTVDFRAELDMRTAAGSDNLEDTVDYGKVYAIVEREMGKSSDLLENVAGRIVRAIEKELPGFRHFSVRVSKHNPPVSGQCEWSRVTLFGGSEREIQLPPAAGPSGL